MAELDQIYNTRLLELAASMPRTARLSAPDGTGSARSRTCGSSVSVDVRMDGDRVADFGQSVKACLLGQAAAAILGREIVGSTAAEIEDVAARMRAMLKANAPPPEGRWAELAVLEPVRDYPQRHTATLLVFEATLEAIAAAASRHREEVDRAPERT
ncbi:MAG: iron-sulfur cluster assembly scaffold protein [Hyphomicrobiaceae bacterium]|nr:iron-sulfur cluster assembly scaffold protein [Hyphomicrobiaceae bacterium]